MVIDDTSSVIKLNQTDLTIGDLRLLTDKVSAQLFSYGGDDWKKLVTSQTTLVVEEKEPRSFYTADNVFKTTSKFVAETTVKLRIKPGTDESTKQKIQPNSISYLSSVRCPTRYRNEIFLIFMIQLRNYCIWREVNS